MKLCIPSTCPISEYTAELFAVIGKRPQLARPVGTSDAKRYSDLPAPERAFSYAWLISRQRAAFLACSVLVESGYAELFQRASRKSHSCTIGPYLPLVSAVGISVYFAVRRVASANGIGVLPCAPGAPVPMYSAIPCFFL